MDTFVETPLPDGWVERTTSGGRVSFENLLTGTTTAKRLAYPASYYSVTPRLRESNPGNPNALELRENGNGNLGYISDGTFVTMYGRPKEVKHVEQMTITHEEGTESFIQVRGIGYGQSKARGKTVVVDNLLFSCEFRPEDPDGPWFKQERWPIDEDIFVRALHPGALRGEGAMVKSNLNRVYIIDATLPRHAKRGYLAVEGLEMVETFLGDFNLKSRFDGYRDSETDEGNRAPSFVVEDNTTHLRPKGYYVTARPSSEDPSRIICHLKKRANGSAKNALRSMLPLESTTFLRDWVMASFPDAKTLLFY